VRSKHTFRTVRAGILALVCLPVLAMSAATFTVTNTDDSGPGSLRQAILDANANAGADTIAFDIPGNGVHTIQPQTPLPEISDPVTIDGYTQPGSSPNTLAVGDDAVLLVEVDTLTAGGLTVSTDNTVIRGLVLSGTLVLSSSSVGGHVIRGNFIGTDPTGTLGRGNTSSGLISTAPNVTIGGPAPADRNVISGNATLSIFAANLYLSENVPGGIAGSVVKGNYLGTNASGTAQVGKTSTNVLVLGDGVTIGGANSGEGNLISGTNGYAVVVSGGDTVLGNLIGTDATGTTPVPNVTGILVSDAGNVIGGVAPGEGNVVAFNLVEGIRVNFGTGNTIRGNATFSNGSIGIDLGSNGISLNDPGDADAGANLGQNFPIIHTVTFAASTITIDGTLDSAPNSLFDLDFYANPGCSRRPADLLQGALYLGAGQVTTDALGHGTFSVELPIALDPSHEISATATDPAGNTSEYSQRRILGIQPRSGPAAGGTVVTATGTHFVTGATVEVGGQAATDVVVSSESELTATIPALSPGTIADFLVVNPDGTSGDFFPAWLADFSDVPAAHPFHAFVETLIANGIAAGCGGESYCVDAPVTRAQMAVFLLKGKHGLCYQPPTATGTVFGDVHPGDFAADWIEALAAEGITGGCGGGNYCPQNPVRRDQMAAFLLKAEHGSDYTPPACIPIPIVGFDDVPCPSLFADWIQQLAAENITGGCSVSPPLYCPLNDNTRGQMAVFISKTFQLP
jgi:hypothetical protein